jgi:hypothetical protein
VSSAPIDFASYRSRFVQDDGALVLPLLGALEPGSGRTFWRVRGVSTLEDDDTGAVTAMRFHLCLDVEAGFVSVQFGSGETETHYEAAFHPDEDPIARAQRESIMQMLSEFLTAGWRLEA